MQTLRGLAGFALFSCLGLLSLPANAQDSGGVARPLPPGILTTIASSPQVSETFTDPRPIVELVSDPKVVDWTPNYYPKSATLKQMSAAVIFRSTIWNLEFSFKPLRMIDVDIPQPSGKLQRKKVWYMVYKVKNNGYHMTATPVEDKWKHKTYNVDYVNQNVFFFPHFVLQGHVPSIVRENGERVDKYTTREYLDRILPAAMKPIAERERVGVKLYDSISISTVPIKVSTPKDDRSVWGVVIWEDLNPHTDFFSIYVQGLTNAYKFEDPAGAYKAGDPPGTGRTFTQKTLQLNFHRLGDGALLHEDEIRYGLPLDNNVVQQEKIFKLYNVPGPLDHTWVYR